MRWGRVRWNIAVVVLAALAVACSDNSTTDATAPSTVPSTVPAGDGQETGTTSGDPGEGSGRHLDAGLLDSPPEATGSTITAEQAEAVSRSVLVAWMREDREGARRFAMSDAVLDVLFATRAPSQEFRGEGYCSEDPDTGSFIGCSYAVVDSSPDGVLAVATDLEIVDGLVVVADAGFAGWND